LFTYFPTLNISYSEMGSITMC